MNRTFLLTKLPIVSLAVLIGGFLILPATAAAQEPDLVLSIAPSGPAEVNRDGDYVVDVEVRNDGAGSVSAEFDVTAYLSADSLLSADDVLVGDAAVTGTLDSSQTKTVEVSVSIRSLQAFGTYYWIVMADQNSVVDESDETNNIRVGNSVDVVEAPPDLLVTTLPVGPAQVTPGGAYTISSSIENIGFGPTTDPFDVSIFLSADSTFDAGDTLVGQSLVADAISSGGTRSFDFDLTIPAGQIFGSFLWLAVIDPNAAQTETDETNNTMVGTGVEVVAQQSDLVVSSPPAGPNGVFRGNGYEVTVEVHNQGNGPTTAAFDIVVYLTSNLTVGDEDDVWMGDIAITDPVDSSQTVTVQIPVQISALQPHGSFYWVARVDDGGFLDESDEGNNNLIGNAFSVVPSPADLVISENPTGPAEVTRNEATSVLVEIGNEGAGATSGAFQVSVYLSADEVIGNSDDVRVGGSSVTTLLGSGETESLSVIVVIPSDQATGSYRWAAVADVNGVETESDELNNSALSDSAVLVVPTPPDLFILADPVGEASVTRGREDTLTVLIRNQGEGSVDTPFLVAVFLSADDVPGNSDDVKVGEQEVSRIITVGGEIAVGVPFLPPADMDLGSYRWVVTADPENEIEETEETNNTRVGEPVEVIPVPPDLIVGGVLGPEHVALGEDYSIVVGVQNEGDGETLEPYGLTVYLSLDDTLGNGDDVVVGSIQLDESLKPDSVRFVSLEVVVPADLPLAIYRWMVVVDEEGNITESNESNNVILGSAVGFALTSVDPEIVDFGEVPLGVVATKKLMVRNDGEAPLAFDISTSESMIRVQPQSVSNLLPGQEWEVTVTFTASAPGNLLASLQITGNGHPGIRTVELTGRVPDPGFASLDLDPGLTDQGRVSTWMVPGRRLPIQLFVPSLPNSGSVSVLFEYDPTLMTFVEQGFLPGSTLNGNVSASLSSEEPGRVELLLEADPGGRIEGGYLGDVLFRSLSAFTDPAGSGPETTVGIIEVIYQPVNGEEQSIPVNAEVLLMYDLLCWSDVTDDGIVGMADFLALATSFKSDETSFDWERVHARFDGDGDGRVGLSDFLLFSRYFGQSCP